MLLCRVCRSAPCRQVGSDDIWSARRFISAQPPEELQALTDPELGRERGLNARVLRAATAALLSGGALDRALARLARELDEVTLLAA